MAEPVTLRVPLGISLGECVTAAGGPTVSDANYIVGGVSIIAAADAAAKAARVTLFRIHVAMALGGKGFCLMTGQIADVQAGVSAAAEVARQRGLLTSSVVIPRPQPEIFNEYI